MIFIIILNQDYVERECQRTYRTIPTARKPKKSSKSYSEGVDFNEETSIYIYQIFFAVNTFEA